MSDKIKAADAKFGEWYEVAGRRLRSISDNPHPNTGTSMKFVSNSGGHVEFVGVDKLITHLPNCTGWDWTPPQPEPDTSLEASIERLSDKTGPGYDTDLYIDDLDRIIEAARKWDSHLSNAVQADKFIQSLRDKQYSTDPDGVGEGWRELHHGDVRKKGDEFRNHGWDRWEPVASPFLGAVIISSDLRDCRYRRRIEPAETPLATVTIQADGDIIGDYCQKKVTPKPKRQSSVPQDAAGTEPLREWTVFCSPENVLRWGVGSDEGVKVREVSPELDQWYSKLVRLCERDPTDFGSHGYWTWTCDIMSHLAKRPQRGNK